ncbi:MAG: DUF2344 domain-containing protein [Stomatobaculum sp.]|nr:DUF2344 domain-containing protein [Stomatobaculum sp.]
MKVRIKFEKRGNLRFIGHLDLMRYFQKANRRAELPIAYSEGFSPHQIMSFAAPLSMGVESTGEYADFKLTDDAKITSEEAVRRMNREMAEGLKILSFLKIPDDAGNCMSTMFAADYRVWFPEHLRFLPEETKALSTACRELLQKKEILMIREGKKGSKEVDIRPMLFRAEADEDGLFFQVAQGSAANLKPEFALSALEELESAAFLREWRPRFVRTELYDSKMRTLESYGEPLT